MPFRGVLASSIRASSGEPIFSTPLFFNALQRQKISTLWRRVAKAWHFIAKGVALQRHGAEFFVTRTWKENSKDLAFWAMLRAS